MRQCLFLMAAILSATGTLVHSFMVQVTVSHRVTLGKSWSRQQLFQTCSLQMASPPPPEAAADKQPTPSNNSLTDRFHADMQRVLQSRQKQQANDPMQAMERFKPVVLNSDVDGAQRVHELLNILMQRGLATEQSFQIVMQAYVNRGRLRWRPSSTTENYDETNNITQHHNYKNGHTPQVICAADQVEALWQELEQRTPPGQTLAMETYLLLLQAYANCATPRGRNFAKRATALWERLVASHGQADLPIEGLMHVLHATAWQQANLQPGIYAEQAKSYLEQICTRTNDPKLLLQAYSWTLEAFSKSGSDHSAETADLLLQQMIHINATAADCDLGIFDAQDFSNAVLAWSKAGDKDAAVRAQAWLDTMIKLYREGKFPAGSEPPLIAFNCAIVAWSRQGDYNRAAAVLWQLDEVRKICQTLQPDVVSYNSVLHAYVRSMAPLNKTIALVKFMHEHCDEQPSIRPNSFTYYTYLKCLLANLGRTADEDELTLEMEDMLNRLEACWIRGDYEMEPTNRIYNMAINAYAKSNNRRAWRKAMNLLQRMKAMASQSNSRLEAVRPDTITITSVMECLSKASDPQVPQIAQSLLREAFDRYHETQDVNDRPNLRTFTMAILTLSKNHGSVVEGRKLLDDLVGLYKETGDASLKPNAYPYNYLLNCAASTSSDEPNEAFQIATRTFQDLRQAGLADSYSYAFWIKCCIVLVTSEELKTNCVRYAFDECKRQGLVTTEVLTRLFQALPRQVVLDEMLEGKVSGDASSSYTAVSVKDLPKEWTHRSMSRRQP